MAQGGDRLDLSRPLRAPRRKRTIPRIISGRCSPSKPSMTQPPRQSSATSPISRRPDCGAGSGFASRRADGAADHGAVHQPAVDPAPGHQQPQPGLHSAHLEGFRERRHRASSGNLQAVITAILTDPEARAGDDPNGRPSARTSATCASRFCSWPTYLRGSERDRRRDQHDLTPTRPN